MRLKRHVDLTPYTFSQFVDFLFEHAVQPESAICGQEWYRNTRVSFDPHRVCEYYVYLFRNSGFLFDRYSRSQLEQGFGAIARGLSCSVRKLIWSQDLQFSEREELVASMSDLCRDIFQRDALGFTASMWWDNFCYDWECGNRRRSRGGEDLLMQDVLFRALSRVLQIDSSICRGSALHGLEHLHHPETLALIKSVILSHPELAQELTEYADAIRDKQPMWMQRPLAERS